MTKENKSPKMLCACAVQMEVDISALDTTGGNEGGQLLSFWKCTELCEKIKTSVENEPQRCKEMKVYEL